MPKNALFLLKNRKNLRALKPPGPLPPAAGSPALAPHGEFLATRLTDTYV